MTPEETRKLVQNNGHGNVCIGSRTSILGTEEKIEVPVEDQRLHVLIIGPIGFGKTQVMIHSGLQQINGGRGVCFINPKGNALDQIISKMPRERWDDIIYINPGNENTTPINVLQTYTDQGMTTSQKEDQKEIIVSYLISLLKRLSNNWGDRFGRVIESLLRAHLELNIYHGEQNTLVDVYNAATDDQTLGKLIERVDDPVLDKSLKWVRYELSDREMEPVVRRLKDFVENKTIRRIVAAPQTGVNFHHALEQEKIILVDVQKGEVGTKVSQLVGSIILTQIWAAAQSRITQPIEERTPYYLYVDELRNYSSEGSHFEDILAEAREYRLSVWLASQYLKQLETGLRRAVSNNTRVKIFFNPSGSEDLSKIRQMLNGVDKTRFTRLEKYQAAIQKPGNSQATIFETCPPWNTDTSRETVEQVKEFATVELEREQIPPLERKDRRSSKEHTQLLNEAKQYLEFQDNVEVKVLDQDGSSKPDGHIIGEDGVAHLEAENSTVSKPERVLTNLRRAIEKDRKCVFITQESNIQRLEEILKDVDPRHYRILVTTNLGVLET